MEAGVGTNSAINALIIFVRSPGWWRRPRWPSNGRRVIWIIRSAAVQGWAGARAPRVRVCQNVRAWKRF